VIEAGEIGAGEERREEAGAGGVFGVGGAAADADQASMKGPASQGQTVPLW
jgi:hypothetical protein